MDKQAFVEKWSPPVTGTSVYLNGEKLQPQPSIAIAADLDALLAAEREHDRTMLRYAVAEELGLDFCGDRSYTRLEIIRALDRVDFKAAAILCDPPKVSP